MLTFKFISLKYFLGKGKAADASDFITTHAINLTILVIWRIRDSPTILYCGSAVLTKWYRKESSTMILIGSVSLWPTYRLIECGLSKLLNFNSLVVKKCAESESRKIIYFYFKDCFLSSYLEKNWFAINMVPKKRKINIWTSTKIHYGEKL